jgi:hypothetical protein
MIERPSLAQQLVWLGFDRAYNALEALLNAPFTGTFHHSRTQREA